jgi:hypothetical protein
VIAVSQDRQPEDGKLHEMVEKSLKELDVNIAGSPVGAVALDPEQLIGDAFGVEGIPMVVVLDGRGVVQAVHLGYREGVGDELAEQVEALLDGKSLVEKPADSAKAGTPGR